MKDLDRLCAFCGAEVHPDDALHDVTESLKGRTAEEAGEPWLYCDFCYESLTASAWLSWPESLTHERKAAARDMAMGFNILRADIRRLLREVDDVH